MTPEERLLRLENAFSTLAELARLQKESTDGLAELTRAQSARMDNSERRTELLIDLAGAQNVRIKECERLLEETRQILKEGAEAQKELREAQKQNEAHLAVLNSIVEELGRGQAEMQKALTRLENSQASLNERFKQYISTRP